MIYFNEIEPYPAAWLGNLYPQAHIDTRSIADVQPDDIRGFQRVHLFAGIGGWEYALHLAGWPTDRQVWTGSAPCQPFSVAGKRKGAKDERHLWPEMFRLIRECRPDTVFGEQVASAIGHGWLDGVFADLEAEGYTCGAIVLGAHSVGAPHIRQRLYWGADTEHATKWRRGLYRSTESHEANGIRASNQPIGSGIARRLADAKHDGWDRANFIAPESNSDGQDGWLHRGSVSGMGPPNVTRSQRRNVGPGGDADQRSAQPSSFWDNYELIQCRDGKARRVESGVCPLVDGATNRVGRLRAYGNAIVPQTAAEFVMAFLDAERIRP